MRRYVLVGLVLAIGVLGGCTTGQDNSGSQAATAPQQGRATAAQEGAGSVDRDADSGESAEGGDDTGDAERNRAGNSGSAQRDTVRVSGQQRKLARTATMHLRVGDTGRAARQARSVVDGVGGYVSAERSDDSAAEVTVKVPADRLDGTLGKLAALGRVTHRQLRAEDVTEEVTDVRSRLATKRESVRRLRGLLERAESTSDVVTVERELASRQTELESLLARQETLSDRVAMSSVQLRLRPEKAATDDSGGFLGGLASGWQALIGAAGALVSALGVTLPFLLALGIPAVVVWWILRRRGTRRSRAAAFEAPGGDVSG